MNSINKLFLFLIFLIATVSVQGQNRFYDYRDRDPAEKVHILYMAGGSFHDHLGVASVLRRFLEVRHEYYVTYSEDYSVFTRSLSEYDIIIMNGMPKTLLDDELAGFLEAVREGKPVLGLHSATAAMSRDTARMKTYDEVFGAHFNGHPPIHRFPVEIKEPNHPITQNLGPFEIYDEMYFFGNIPNGSTILIEAEHNERGRTPTAWVKQYGKGKVFYTSLGHGVGAATNRYFQQLLLNALEWLVTDEE